MEHLSLGKGITDLCNYLKESLQISSLVASYSSSMDAFTVADDVGGPLELPWSCLNKKEAFCKLRPTV